jgi:hypothetical protein
VGNLKGVVNCIERLVGIVDSEEEDHPIKYDEIGDSQSLIVSFTANGATSTLPV